MSVFLYGDNVDTDVIIPARYLNLSNPASLAAHCMEDIDPSFSSKVKAGDIIAAGENFGCGSSREHAPLAIKASGVSVVIAKSFARIFFRNAVNIGLPIMECDIPLKPESDVKADIVSGVIEVDGTAYQARPVPAFIREIIGAGGLLNAIAREKRHDL